MRMIDDDNDDDEVEIWLEKEAMDGNLEIRWWRDQLVSVMMKLSRNSRLIFTVGSWLESKHRLATVELPSVWKLRRSESVVFFKSKACVCQTWDLMLVKTSSTRSSLSVQTIHHGSSICLIKICKAYTQLTVTFQRLKFGTISKMVHLILVCRTIPIYITPWMFHLCFLLEI